MSILTHPVEKRLNSGSRSHGTVQREKRKMVSDKHIFFHDAQQMPNLHFLTPCFSTLLLTMAQTISTSDSFAKGSIPANRDRLFLASCVALIVTAMTFAIRAGILNQLGAQFGLDNQSLGYINSMAFYGFPIAMMVGGLLYNSIGPKMMLWIAFATHLLGLVLTMTAGGFWGLMISTFCIGFANGSVEAACNPLVADMYPEKQTEMLNKFHVWFPGGIVVGSLVSLGLTQMGFEWEILIASMLIPTAIYGFLIFGQDFPRSVNVVGDTSRNIRGVFTGLFLFIAVCMTITATTEFGATQWIDVILSNAGANGIVLLLITSGVMAAGRFFAGPIVHRLNPVGVLLMSATLAALGLWLLSFITGPMIYVATLVYALGICYFWPTMVGLAAEYVPESGALGLSLIGGAGMLGSGLWLPYIGQWIDQHKAEAVATGITEETAINLFAGQATLSQLVYFPLVLIVLFVALYFWVKDKRTASQIHGDQFASGQDMPIPGSAR